MMYMAVNNFQFIGAAYGKIIIALVMVLVSGVLVITNFKQQKVNI